MGHAIPRIEYKNTDTTGDVTTGSNTISGVLGDTDFIEAGMFVRGAGIPVGATVSSVAGDSVNFLGLPATAMGEDVNVFFGYEIEFDYPPKNPNGETLDTKATISESLSGIRQVSKNFTEASVKLAFSFLSPALYIKVDDFLKSWALAGNDFRYFEDKTLPAYVSYELDTLKVTPAKIASRGTSYVWEVPLVFRRIV